MPALAALSLAALFASLVERRRRHDDGLHLDGIVIAGALWLALVGGLTTLLALVGVFGSSWVCITIGFAAAATWPWRVRAPTFSLRPGRVFASALLVVVAGLSLRFPLADYPLAGRDQGTYTLRAQHTLREGRLDAVDPVLASIEETRSRPGPADLRGLYSRRREPWRRNLYEASYRPGFYLGDIDRGVVRPQFFHLHPMLMATAGLLFGPAGVIAVVPLYSALSLLAVFAVARRFWPRGPWALYASGLWVCAPIVIWVQRTPLSEGPATLFVWATVLAVLRVRDGDDDASGLTVAALLLGANAWVRGNGWLAVPIILAAQWLVPRTEARARRAGLAYAAVFLAAVAVHAPTTFPYLHDELLRQLPLEAHLSPMLLMMASIAGVAAWFSIDELGPLRRNEARWLPALHRYAPSLLAAALVGAVALYWALRPEVIGRPFSRLDPVLPLVGLPALLLAAVGLGRLLRRWPGTPSGANAWLLGLGGVLVLTTLLYAQRNLPQLGLYYYGRYLVPELVPAVALLAVEGVRGIVEGIAGAGQRLARQRVAIAIGLVGAAGLAWSWAGVLVQHPVTRLREFAGADRVLDHLASKIPANAIVIAGGEGWHSGHTFNQVGGALAFRHGIAVLPYRDKEAAYATLHELLIGRPNAGEAAVPVFLLLNEATKDHTRDPKDPEARIRIAALDDLLPPPFVARRVDLVEMFLQRLTPTHEGAPKRVTRDGLRMALLRVEVDPERAEQVEQWEVRAADKEWRVEGPPGLGIEGGKPRKGIGCLGKKKTTTVTLPPSGGAGTGPVSLVVVAAPGTARRNHTWSIEVDGQPLAITPVRTTPRDRDTLGPFVFSQRPSTIVIRGAGKKTRRARCPYGGLAQVRLLGPDTAMLATAETTATTFAPTRPLGHPVEPVAWVSGRGLSRHRPGVTPTPTIEGLSLRVGPGPALEFPPAMLPEHGTAPYDVIVTLTASHVPPEARLVVHVDGQPLAPIDPPDERNGSWQSPALRVEPTSAAADISIELRDAGHDDHVMLRDIGLFSRGSILQGQRATP